MIAGGWGGSLWEVPLEFFAVSAAIPSHFDLSHFGLAQFTLKNNEDFRRFVLAPVYCVGCHCFRGDHESGGTPNVFKLFRYVGWLFGQRLDY